MSGKRKSTKSKPQGTNTTTSSSSHKKDHVTNSKFAEAGNTTQQLDDNNGIPSAGYLISCDVPTKQYIIYMNELKPPDKKFIIQDLDSTHLLVECKAKDEIERKIEDWLDENIFSAVEKVGEDFDMS